MLDDRAIERYARQIVIPGIGAAGQEKLLAATVLVVGNERGVAQAALYLRAAGIRVIESARTGDSFDVAVVACPSTLDTAVATFVAGGGKPVCWYELEQAGFTSGVHPDAPMPLETRASQDNERNAHDAAACDVAALCCAMLVGLPAKRAAVHVAANWN